MRLRARGLLLKLALAATLALLFVPFAAAQPPTPGPLVGVCVAGVTSSACYDHGLVCVGISQQIPFCVHSPCDSPYISCDVAVSPPPSVSCTEVVGIGFVGAVCTVNGKQVGPIATCDACLPILVLRCTETTDGKLVDCTSSIIQLE